MCATTNLFSVPLVTEQGKTVYSKALFEKKVLDAVQKKIPAQKFGILFSGGIDSLVLAKACQKLGKKPLLFVAGIKDPITGIPKDVMQARKVAHHLKLSLIETVVSFSKAQKLLPQLVSVIKSSNPVQVGIAMPIHLACQTARQKKCHVLLSGTGADGLLGGFFRQQNAKNLNQVCLSYVLNAFENDLNRENAIALQNKVELRRPYYAPNFVTYCLQIPAKVKIVGKTNKKPLRDLGLHWDLPALLVGQPKKAAQYGSNADKLITKLSKKNGFKTKGAFLESFLEKPKQRLGALISGGKDGWLAAFIQHQKNDSIECLIAMQSKNPDSFMFHTPNIELVKEQSKASNIPLILGKTHGAKELELKDLKKTIQIAQQKFRLDAIVNGALQSNYQRVRIEKVCDALGLKVYAPLWQKNQLQELEQLVQNEFEVIFSSIAAQGFNESWLGRRINGQTIQELEHLHQTLKINAAGEGGEFETLVLDCPLFKQKIIVENATSKMRNACTGKWVISKTKLEKKN
ncbi:diphthine--ammonia ligase [Candidatus Micrarchaeota archaeon]|nr:diphthine--ammonia ligase [Candidatus Micrarchaeota archaeon]MBU1930528.1 diphthine--ammonia ligase [Candidatus Micrarchaeota archaeon]